MKVGELYNAVDRKYRALHRAQNVLALTCWHFWAVNRAR